jgi:hypothetical protein
MNQGLDVAVADSEGQGGFFGRYEGHLTVTLRLFIGFSVVL